VAFSFWRNQARLAPQRLRIRTPGYLIPYTYIVISKILDVSRGEWAEIGNVDRHAQPILNQISECAVNHSLHGWSDSDNFDPWPVGEPKCLISDLGRELCRISTSATTRSLGLDLLQRTKGENRQGESASDTDHLGERLKLPPFGI